MEKVMARVLKSAVIMIKWKRTSWEIKVVNDNEILNWKVGNGKEIVQEPFLFNF